MRPSNEITGVATGNTTSNNFILQFGTMTVFGEVQFSTYNIDTNRLIEASHHTQKEK